MTYPLIIESIINWLIALSNTPEFLVKILPTCAQFALALLGSSRLTIYHVLRRNPNHCPRLKNVSAGPALEKAIREMPSVRNFTFELTRLQSTVGLILTIVTSIILSNSMYYRFWFMVFVGMILLFYYKLRDTDYSRRFDQSGRIYSLGVAVLGVLVIYASSMFQ